MKLQTCGSAAIQPIAPDCQPRTFVANAMTNGKFGIVRFSIGTLKHASTVEYFSDSSTSRLRSDSMRFRHYVASGGWGKQIWQESPYLHFLPFALHVVTRTGALLN